MKRETGLRTVILLIILGLCVISLIPTVRVFMHKNEVNLALEKRTREIFKREHPEVAAKAINLGLDLAGGTHIIVEVHKEKLDKEAQKDVMDRSLEILRNRVDQYGLSEPIITRSGDNRIVADLAGMGAEDARRLIGATALLEFKLIPEVTEFKPVLDKIDAYLNRRSGHLPISKGASPANDTARAVQDIFGRVVTGDSAKTGTTGSAKADSAGAKKDSALAKASPADSAKKDSAAAADTSETAAEFYKNRPFGALLIAMGRDLAVKAENVEKAKAILEDSGVQALIPQKYQFLWGREIETHDNVKTRRLYLLKRRPEMTGATIADARPNRLGSGSMNAGEVEVSLTFKGLGPKEFKRVTSANVGRQLAIVLDSVVYSAPVIQGAIPNGRASITGIGDINEAKQLAVTLRAGSLPAPMSIVELRSVGPTLGEDNIHKGLMAAIVALALVAGFMAFYYKGAGLIADLALLLNMIILFAVLGAFHATLTLPGIAGIVLTIGMAVDSNVLIFERIREELRHGRSVRAAIDAGYKKAFSAIFDSNVTTLGTAAILYYIGVGPIKGFGLTLMVGLGASMYTAIVVTRLVFDYILKNRDVKELSIGKGVDWFHEVDIKVIPWAKYYVGLSVIVLALALGAIAVRGLHFGIDFTGGHVYRVQFQEQPNVEEVRKEIQSAGLENPRVQTLGAQNENRLMIFLPNLGEDAATKGIIAKAVKGATIEGEDTVGPSVGKDLRQSALLSILSALVLIVLYIWFRFGRNGLGFGVGGVLGLIHDSLITLGLFALFGMEISLDFVAAILTIIGYSLNDSIIIFDRIRELTGVASSKESFATRVNNANNQCLSRSIITHLTVLFTVVILAVMGASSVRDFSIAMVIGVFVGTYSTIAVACPFVVWWDRRRLRPAPAKK
ncbi:MAG: protein translocase subunit SecD [Fibrobacteres bacterium]|jgi:SecD/SecF fusion protein|nr:protein translocase subunit SecD [Fibrobacterota bacterium]